MFVLLAMLFVAVVALVGVTATLSNTITVDGVQYKLTETIEADRLGGRIDKTGAFALAAAKVGALTTRGSNTAGTLTMNSGHGFQTGDRLDIYWTDADGYPRHRRGVTVGTVATNSVPFTGGSGDNLPTLVNGTYAITAQVPVSEVFEFTGNNAAFIFAKSSRKAIVVFADGSNVELAYIVKELSGTSGGGYQWTPATNPITGLVDSDGGITNPLAGDTVAKVFLSNGSSAGTNEVVVGVGAN